MMLFHNKFSMIALVLSLAMIVVAAAGSAETDVRRRTNDATNVSPVEMQALFDLYNSTDGDNWIWQGPERGIPWNFTVTANPCADHWQGLYCLYSDGQNYSYINTIELEAYGLSGSLPDSIGSFTQITEITLDENFITGTLPTSMGNLVHIIYLDVGTNELTGSIPASLFLFEAPLSLLFYENQLTGTIPTYFDSLSLRDTLLELGFSDNLMNGTIPTSVSTLSVLQLLNLDGNHFSGTIAPELGSMAGLEQLSLGYNFLTHTIPATLGSAPVLTTIGVGSNKLTGTIPNELGNLKLTYLNVSDNRLVGTIPDTLVSLQRVFLTNNKLSGPIPANLGEWSNVTQLYLSSNRLTGPIPPGIGQLKQLRFVYADNNLLSGPIPPALGDIRQLISVNLSVNLLSGSVPRSFASIQGLQVLLLRQNALSGDLNGVFSPALQYNLTSVQLSDNQLTGTLPTEAFLLPSLQVFAAVSNCFRGSIPSSVCEARHLQALALDGLQSASSCRQKVLPDIWKGGSAYTVKHPMTGGIPDCLFELPMLTTLHLSGNSLGGVLPSNVTFGRFLTQLSLSHNDLKGDVPDLYQQRGWDNLDLSYNRIGGTLYNDFAVPDNASLTLEQNRLSGAIPHSFYSVLDISILGSNLFSCTKGDIPEHQGGKDHYQCGSYSLNQDAMTWLGITGGVVLALVVAWLCRQVIVRNFGVDMQNIYRLLLQWWNVVDTLSDSHPHKPKLDTYTEVCSVLNLAITTSLACCVYIVLLLLPAYGITSLYYHTLTHQYAWTASAAFVSGRLPFALFFVLLFFLVLMFAACLVTQLPQHPRSTVYNTLLTPKEGKPPLRIYIMVYVIFMVFNFAVVVGVNIGYVYIALNYTGSVLTLSQVLMSLFKLGFNRMVAPYVLYSSAEYLRKQTSTAEGSHFLPSEFIALQLWVALANNVLIPCLVVAAISPSCFVNVFQAPPTVTSTFYYNGNCIQETEDDDGIAVNCLKYQVLQDSTTYQPPYKYNYQCSSSFITYYAPAFVNVCIFATFLAPVSQIVLKFLHGRAEKGTRWFALLNMMLPRILKPLATTTEGDAAQEPPVSEMNIFALHFDACHLLVSVLTHLGMTLTFGAVFPPLAVTFLVAIVSVVGFNRLKVGRFISAALEQNQPHYLEILSQECAGVSDPVTLKRAMRAVVLVSWLFYTLFLFDTLGDTTGLRGAFWVLVVMPLMPAIVMVGYQSYLTARCQHPFLVDFNRDKSGAGSGADAQVPAQFHVELRPSEQSGHAGEKESSSDATFNVLQKI